MRFLVDHCVPAEVAAQLRAARQQAWTAYDAHLEDGPDEAIVIYAASKQAIVVTTNKDFIPVARRLATTRVVYLRVIETHAAEAMTRALAWLDSNHLPEGRVLRVPRTGTITVMSP